MANYLLLRNNQESGPYSLDDLMRLGLKAYDLVWVQGRSAAWRYPSEVDELKPFAPIVEEQPYDRFYKKQESSYSKEEAPSIPPEHQKYIPKKSVFVTMPGGQKTMVEKPVKKEESFVTPPPTITVSENPATAQLKYSQPLDEIKEMYVKTLHDRKQRIARKGFWLQNLKRAAMLLSLVAVGVIVGFIIKSNGKKQPTVTQHPVETQPLKSTTVQTTPDTTQQETILPVPNGGYVNKEVIEQKQEDKKEQPSTQESTQEKDKVVVEKPKAEMPPSRSPGTDTKNTLVSKGVDTDPATGERRRNVRNETDPAAGAGTNPGSTEKTRSSGELYNQVSVTSNEYKRVAFGGIRDLQLTVNNDSKFILEYVTVELQYLKPSEQPLKTESIQFKSVGPKATSTIRVPDTNRGIKVVFRITDIKARNSDESVAGRTSTSEGN